MAYDNPIMKEYEFPAVNLGAAFSRNIRGPKGRRGRVIRANLSVTTTIVGAPVLSVTTTASPVPASPSYPTPPAQSVVLAWFIPAQAAPIGGTSDAIVSSVVRDVNYNFQIIPADADVVLALTTLATSGVGDLSVEIHWF